MVIIPPNNRRNGVRIKLIITSLSFSWGALMADSPDIRMKHWHDNHELQLDNVDNHKYHAHLPYAHTHTLPSSPLHLHIAKSIAVVMPIGNNQASLWKFSPRTNTRKHNEKSVATILRTITASPFSWGSHGHPHTGLELLR